MKISNQFELDCQLHSAKIIANLLTEEAATTDSQILKGALQEEALGAMNVYLMLQLSYSQILKDLKREKVQENGEMVSREGVINGNGPALKGLKL